MQIDADAFADAFQFHMTEQDLSELMMSMSNTQSANYDSNLEKLGYVDFDEPGQISIYPKDFDNKEKVVKLLDDYNQRMEKEGKDEQVISYTDVVGTLMSSVTDIVDTISYVLIAFVAISLVVSSIMIGVITYISVLERKKEIGILRAIGASRHNVSQVFNAETFIIGFCAGAMGIGITLLLGTTDYMGAGAELIEKAVEEGQARPLDFFWKLILTALTMRAGFRGGEIVPSFCIGATFGCVMGNWLGLSPSICAACGMAAVFCGVTNCPITSILIAFEMFGFKGVSFYLIAVSISYAASGYYGLYKDQTIVYSKYKAKYVNRHTRF